MEKIHFVSLFGVDLDYDIMVPWATHYTAMNYDTYTVFLHSVNHATARYETVRDEFVRAGFYVIDAPTVPYTTQMRNELLENFSRQLNPLDYMCVADSDEFHITGGWVCNFRDLILSCDCLYGTLVDRWADSLHEAKASISLDEQYPYEGDVFSIVREKSADPEKSRWRVPNANKILAARAGLPVSHAGSHVLYSKPENLKERRGCIVNHFKWRHTIIDRLKTKWYHHDGFDRAVMEFFNVEGVPA